MSNFSPPLSPNGKLNLYLDTSIVHVLVMAGRDSFGKSIKGELSKYPGKQFTSDYVIYEIKKSCLKPIWAFYNYLEIYKDAAKALLKLSQNFKDRENKVIIELFGMLAANNTKLDLGWDMLQAKLLGLASQIQNDLKIFNKRIVPNLTKCNLHKPEFSVAGFDEAVKCRTECEIEKFWAKNNSITTNLEAHVPPSTEDAKTKKWFKKMKPAFKLLAADSKYGKQIKTCPKFADTIIILHAPRTKFLVLSIDHAFIALSKITGHSVHQLMSPSAYLGATTKAGTSTTTAAPLATTPTATPPTASTQTDEP